ncbi:MAG: regulatory protein RecX [Oscillospiraceae bacterium]|nr:regulatory protein RecX [Oscillospiraceae bacterium]
MLISALKQTSPGRVTVCFEDGKEIKSTLAVITDMRLFSGKDLDEEDQKELENSSLRSIARDRCIEMLSRRRMSRKELIDKLLRKGESEDIAEFCADWLEEKGFLDDESYAAAVARHYANKGYGAGRVRSELHRRGVERELWDEAVDNMPPVDDKLDKLVAQKLKDPEDKDQLRKLSASLYRRGYSWEEIRSALRRHNAQTEDFE